MIITIIKIALVVGWLVKGRDAHTTAYALTATSLPTREMQKRNKGITPVHLFWGALAASGAFVLFA